MKHHSFNQIFLALVFSLGICSCGAPEKDKEKQDSLSTAKELVSQDSIVSVPRKDSVVQEILLSDEALKYQSDLLANPDLMNMEQKETIIKYDLSSLFTQTSSHQIMGFIGDNYQRIQIKFISVTKNADQADVYTVSGKTKVKNNICDFKGTMRVIASRQFLENDFPNEASRVGFILFEYTFYEDAHQKGTGIFEGIALSNYYLNKQGQLLYDDLMSGADGFDNNQFVGVWQGYNSSKPKRCNWGDYRIPNSRGFDMGAGEFYPAEEYRQNGWMDYHNAYFSSSPDANAQERERAEWWK